MPVDDSIVIEQMEMLKGAVLSNLRILAPHNPEDYYYQHLLELADAFYFFETYQVILWAGLKLQPKRILEIGTRNGGSLVQLLSAYHRHNGLRVVCFDLWREIGSPEAVRRNLQVLNIPSDFIEFVSGDSTLTVPEWRARHRDERFDYVLVDGGHDAVTAATDLANVADLVAPGGIIIFDDVCPVSYGLLPVWRQFQAEHEGQFEWHEKLWRKGVTWGIRQPPAA